MQLFAFFQFSELFAVGASVIAIVLVAFFNGTVFIHRFAAEATFAFALDIHPAFGANQPAIRDYHFMDIICHFAPLLIHVHSRLLL